MDQMETLTVTCPDCGTNISLHESLQSKANEQLKRQIEHELKNQYKLKMEDLQEQIKEKQKYLESFESQQLDLQKKIRILEKKEKEVEFEIHKRVTSQIKTIENDLRKQTEEVYKFELLQKDQKINEMKNVVSDLQRKVAQGSQQTQGEVIELDFENQLKLKFPWDEFQSVAKGISGADLLQKVRSKAHQLCGLILYEFKNTKNFSPSWIPKLKEDQRKSKAHMAVLVTKTMPKDSEGEDLVLVDGVYVTSFNILLQFAGVLRKNLEELYLAQLVSHGRDEKMSQMYSYLTGPMFKQKFKGIINAYKTQKDELEREKRALMKIWAKREKQLEIIIDSSSSLYGDIEAIIGHGQGGLDDLELLSSTHSIEEIPTNPNIT